MKTVFRICCHLSSSVNAASNYNNNHTNNHSNNSNNTSNQNSNNRQSTNRKVVVTMMENGGLPIVATSKTKTPTKGEHRSHSHHQNSVRDKVKRTATQIIQYNV